MKTKLTENGLSISRIVAGCMSWGEWGAKLNTDQVSGFIEDCLELDVTTFDHADIYGHYTTEKLFGSALKSKSSIRSQIQLVTKCGIQLITPNRPANTITHYETSKKYIIRSAERSLQNLQTDYIDLLLIHRPSPLMNPSEIAEAFSKLKKEGKVRFFGVSNFTTTQFEMLHALFPLQTNQIEISPIHLQPFLDGSLDQCIQHKIKPMAYSVMGGGKLFQKNPDQKTIRLRNALTELAERHHVSLDQIVMAWVFKHPARIIPILGTTKKQRMKAAVQSVLLEISDQEWFTIWEASMGEPVP